ncbi:flagellar hook-basal body complex protein FliE [Cellulomonas rhizosphaerae]|jgi:flagellar hook-basal body complex protein FliE|uniref:Flagellar hook-basal body complex protein FliE n=1 Tax=Cellulomonas rhizosphaerae TaxID=2293719 RepID=A0A413RPU9_9CELL|nr:flagellar hook-basal body complex protein FliE [Cellulomonas rhizosphaerae]RHA44019.1 flagellar hook-basal body complex protein FliE [Cellulomonas rhizosphaerae]
MTLPVAAVGAATPVLPTGSVGATAAVPAGHGAAFDSVLGSVDGLQQLQSTSSDLAVQAATGSLENVHDYTIAAAKSSLAIELTAAVRNKAVEAFSEIMRMQA